MTTIKNALLSIPCVQVQNVSFNPLDEEKCFETVHFGPHNSYLMISLLFRELIFIWSLLKHKMFYIYLLIYFKVVLVDAYKFYMILSRACTYHYLPC